MQNWLTNNLSLKILALALAIITWVYVNSALMKSLP